jgi:FlaA1/EpsC-like NDP-sugar epimerase
VLAGLLFQGLYRTDWQHFSMRSVWSIVFGVTLGLGITYGFLAMGPFSGGHYINAFAAAWGITIVSVAGTRVFVKRLSAALRAGSEAAPGPRLTKDLTR